MMNKMKISNRQLDATLISIGFLPVIVKLVLYPSYPGSDDAYIHMQVVRNIVGGLGWGINPLEPVNVSTSPLFTILLTIGHAVGVGLESIGPILSGAATILGVWLTGKTALHIWHQAEVAIVTAALAASNLWLWRWTGTTMEATCGFLAVAAIVYFYRSRCLDTDGRDRTAWLALGAIVGLATLIRPELFLLSACIVADGAFREKVAGLPQKAAFAILGGAVVLVCWIVFAWIYFGNPVPTTYYAKTTDGVRLINAVVGRQIISVMGSGLFGVGLVAIAALTGHVRKKERQGKINWFQAEFLIPIVLCGFYYTRTAYLQSAARYLLPAMAAVPLLAVAWSSLAWTTETSKAVRIFVVAAVLQVAASGAIVHTRIAPVLSKFTDNYVRTMRDTADEIRTLSGTDRPNVLVVIDIGALSYYGNGEFRVIDGGALATPEMNGLTVRQQFAKSRPQYIVESLGKSKGALGRQLGLEDSALISSRSFESMSTSQPDRIFFTNLFRTGVPTE